jgi:hypothetical protein
MKIIITESQYKILTESKNIGKLYHYTRNLDSLLSILKTNKLIANVHNKYYQNDTRYLTKSKNLRGKKIEDQPVKPHISFTRVKDFYRKTSVLLIFDGKNISHNYKIQPYSMDYEMRNRNNQPGFVGYDEFEERVYSDIKNVERYLDKIEIDFGSYNFLVYTNDELIDNFNKCVEIKELFPNTFVFGNLKVKQKYEPDTLEMIKTEFPNIIFK